MRVTCPNCGENISITHGPRVFSEETREHYGSCYSCNSRYRVLIDVIKVKPRISPKQAAPVRNNELSLPL